MTDREGGEGFDARELLYDLRGVPDHCSFCDTKLPAADLEPEEGGDWVCLDCLLRWEKKDVVDLRAHVAALQARVAEGEGLFRTIPKLNGRTQEAWLIDMLIWAGEVDAYLSGGQNDG